MAAVAEMAYPQKIARDIIIGLSRPINQHLVKLVAFDFPTEVRHHFKRELRNWLDEIQTMRLQSNSRTGSFKFYYDPLFDYPFGGVELNNTKALIDFISREYEGIEPAKTPEQVLDFLKGFHAELAQRLHNGQTVFDLIPA